MFNDGSTDGIAYHTTLSVPFCEVSNSRSIITVPSFEKIPKINPVGGGESIVQVAARLLQLQWAPRQPSCQRSFY